MNANLVEDIHSKVECLGENSTSLVRDFVKVELKKEKEKRSWSDAGSYVTEMSDITPSEDTIDLKSSFYRTNF